MTDQIADTPDAKQERVFVKRHKLGVRLGHWINVLALIFLLLSGLQIFNAHPALYWGQASTFDDPWLSMKAYRIGDDIVGRTQIGDLKVDTTGVLGRSKRDGEWETRGFPSWLTLPPQRSLADGRNFHFFWAWVFAINGLAFLVFGFISRHLTRDVLPGPKELATVYKDPHLRLKFSKGPDSARYHQTQKIAYSTMIFIVLPLVALTGMTMSPGLNAAFPFLLDIFGGRQSARSIHFICAALIVAFFLVHILMVVLSGPINQVRAMITGKLAIQPEDKGAA